MTTPGGQIIWVVSGECGSYSDYTTWTVAAYLNKSDAEEHVRLAQEWVDSHQNRRYYDIGDNPYDDTCYYADTHYGVSWLCIHSDPAQFKTEKEVLTDKLRELG